MSHGMTWWKWGNPWRFVIVTPYMRCINRSETIWNHPKPSETMRTAQQGAHSTQNTKTCTFLRARRGLWRGSNEPQNGGFGPPKHTNTLESATTWLYSPSSNMCAWYDRYVHSHLSATTWNLTYYNLYVHHRPICPSFFINLRVSQPSQPKYVMDGLQIKCAFI